MTGASGFVGGHLARHLLMRGHDVRLLVRPQSRRKVRTLEHLGARVFEGDARDLATVVDAAIGCEMAYHAAGLVYGPHSPSDYYGNNVDATETVIGACERAHVHKLIYISDCRVVCAGRDISGDETLPFPDRHRDAYTETKAAAERLVMDAHRTGRAIATVVRPGWVWGPGDTTTLPRLLRLKHTDILPSLARADRMTATLYIDDLVQGAERAADTADSAGEVFCLTDDVEITPRDMVLGLLAACNAGSWPMHQLPPGLDRMTQHATRWFAKIAAHFDADPPMPSLLDLLTLEQHFSCAKAKAMLGYQPAMGIAAGLIALREWSNAQ